ncbi:Pentatricopeptide repeat-containing protein [Apostasia shenzhenica]|uniref:Pentatricopeptide repeat-containing protein n=1 Tax=Apostasia shenzhenica TaxID=1088818 RepID=A0A2I0B873_9ASPA|nr:Pentatricopeptide repeat-containing protein [Apostasia shenzhenica]
MRHLPFRTTRSLRFSAPTGVNLCWPTTFPATRPPPEVFELYISLLQRCAAEKSIFQTRQTHLHMKQKGFPHLSLGNKLIDAYLKSGSVDDARKVFDEMPHPHIVSWNSMISSYICGKRNHDAIALYRRMFVENVVPDEFTFSSIFRAFSDLDLVHAGRAAHGQLVVLGFLAGNHFVGSALVNMYAKFGRLREARTAYSSTNVRDVVLATALIAGYTQKGEDKEACWIFAEMVNNGIKANDFTFSSILKACGNMEDLASGKTIHGIILKNGFNPSISSATSLLTMYSKCCLIEDSLKVFAEILNPNTVTWTAMIGCLSHSHREEQALSTFCSMIRSSVRPNAFTLSTVLGGCSSLALLEQGKSIHAYAIKTGLDTQRFVISALVDTYGKCGNVEMARVVFDCLPDPDVVSVNALIYSYAQDGNGIEAMKLYDMMQRMGIEPNDATFVNVLSACSNSGLLEEGRRVFSSIAVIRDSQPSKDHYACMIDMLARAGRLEEAEELIIRVEKPDKVLWRTLLGACKIHGRLEMAQRAAGKVLEIDPGDDGTYILLSNIYASLGQWKEVINIKSFMRKMGFRKDPAVSWIFDANKIIHSFMAGDKSHRLAGKIYKELEDLIEKTKCLGYVPNTRFVLQEMDELEKEKSLLYHSEKLAVAFGVLNSRGKSYSSIAIFKNLRVCGDCHNWIKLVSKVTDKEIIARDAKRFHKFRDGLCSCGDYW